MANSVPAQLLAAIKARKWTAASRLFASDVQFEAWAFVTSPITTLLN